MGRCDLTLVGQVTRADAEAMLANTGQIRLRRRERSRGLAPLCYAYWVRAYDAAQNLYDGDRRLSRRSPSEYRLHCACVEQTAPPAPIDHRVSEPATTPCSSSGSHRRCRTCSAFHVYRSDEEIRPADVPRLRLHRRHRRLARRGTGLDAGRAPTCRRCRTRSTARGSLPRRHGRFPLSGSLVGGVGSGPAWANASEAAEVDEPAHRAAQSSIRTTDPLSSAPGPSVLLPSPTCGFEIAWSPAFDRGSNRGSSSSEARTVARIDRCPGSWRATSSWTRPPDRVSGTAYRIQSIDRLNRLSEPSVAVIGTY